MYPYWILFGFFGLGSLISPVDLNPRKPLPVMLLGGLLMVCMIGLRWQVGADWFSYLFSWRLAATRSLASFIQGYDRDYIFYTLMWSFRQGGLPLWSFYLLNGAIFTIGLLKFARTVPSPWIGVTVAIPYLVVVVAMSGVRQATAIGFMMLALVAFHKRRTGRFLIYIAMASGFHASAILVLPLAGLSFARTRLQASALVVIILIAAYYILSQSFSGYSERYLSESAIKSNGTLVRIGMNVIPALIFLRFRKRFPIEEHESLLWRNMSYASLASLAALFFVASTTALDRVALYFFPLQIFVFGWFVWLAKRPAERSILTMLLIFYLALQLFVFLNFGVNSQSYVPYRTILSQ